LGRSASTASVSESTEKNREMMSRMRFKDSELLEVSALVELPSHSVVRESVTTTVSGEVLQACHPARRCQPLVTGKRAAMERKAIS
jgi:hypothetical protein